MGVNLSRYEEPLSDEQVLERYRRKRDMALNAAIVAYDSQPNQRTKSQQSSVEWHRRKREEAKNHDN